MKNAAERARMCGHAGLSAGADCVHDTQKEISMFTRCAFYAGVFSLLACAAIFAGCANTPPANVSGFTATAGDGQVVLAWTLPSDANFKGVLIQRKLSTFPTSPTDGTTAYDGNGATFTDTSLENGKLYCYAAFSYNSNRKYSAGVQASATPTSVLAQAGILSAIADESSLLATFPASVFDGPTQTALQGDLGQIDDLYRAGDICGAADAALTYLDALQGLRHDAAMAASEILYNSGRMIRYDMLSAPAAKASCPDAARVGQGAEAVLDTQGSDLGKVQVSFNFGEPKVFSSEGNGEIFTQVTVPGTNSATTAAGLPSIPMLSQLVAVPDGAAIGTDVNAMEAEQIQLKLYPAQQSGIAQSQHPAGVLPSNIALPPFTKDPGAYQSDQLYPASQASVTDIGTLRGLHYVRVDVPAVQYNAATNTLRLFSQANVTLTFTGGKGYGTYDPGNLFEPLVNVSNKLAINGSILGSLLNRPFTGNSEGAELLIITNAKFLDSANRLAQFKTNEGIVTNVVSVGATAVPTAAALRTLIVNRWSNYQIKFSYVLLIGDVNYIPPYHFATNLTNYDSEPDPPSDFGYSTLGDPEPRSWSDWVVGRLPVNETGEADAAVNKIINYEQNPTSSADFYKHATLCTDFECCQAPLDSLTIPLPFGGSIVIPFSPPLGQGRERQPFLQPLETAKAVLETRGFNVQRLYIEDIYGGDAEHGVPAYTADPAPRTFCDGDALPAAIGSNPPGVAYPVAHTADLMNGWNDGRIFVFYNSHGWCNGPGWWGVPFGYWDAAGLLQDQPLPVVFSTTCDSGFYDLELNSSCDPGTTDPCFAESLVRADRRGAVSIIAAPRETLIHVNGHLTEGYANAITHFGTTTKMRLADVFLYGQGWITGSCDPTDARGSNRLYHIFGDPSLRVRMQKPPLTIASTGISALLQSAGQIKVNCGTEGATVTAFLTLENNTQIPVGRGIVKNGAAMLQMLTTRTAAAVNVGAPLKIVATHPDAMPVSVAAMVGQ